MAQAGPAHGGVGQSGTGEGASGSVLPGNAGASGVVAMVVQAPAPEPPRRFPAHYLWAVLIARIYEVFPLVCPLCAYFSPSWTAFHAERGRCFSAIVDDLGGYA